MTAERLNGLDSDGGEPAAQVRPLLSVALRERTGDLHTQAERSGVVNDILRGNASRHGYALLLRNLLPAYEAMEQGLDSHRDKNPVSPFAMKEVYRTGALYSDLAALCGDDWKRALPLLPAGLRYAQRVADAAQGNGERLIAHAYARYLGDFSGGQILKKLLGRALALNAEALSFYEFPRIADTKAFKEGFRDALDRAGELSADFDAIVEEGAVAFELNIDVSNAVQRAAADK